MTTTEDFRPQFLDSSQKALDELESTGQGDRQRQRVLNYVRTIGKPVTAGEICNALRGPNQPHASFHRRCAELEAKGLVERNSVKRACSVTGKTVYEWAPSGTFENPLAPPKKMVVCPKCKYEFPEVLGRIIYQRLHS